jgi:ergothioneine biosynthesis protein EgtB
MISALTHISERFLAVRRQTEKICKPLKPEDHVVQPIVDVSPPKWHLGHTTWFFETFILQPNLKGYKIFDPNYNFLFNSYYESVGARVIRTNRGNITRPGVDEVLQYRKYVDNHMSQFLEQTISDEIAALLELGIQHEQQHQELLIYDIKYILGKNPLFPSYEAQSTTLETTSRPMEWLSVEEGLYTIGHEGEKFSFDNEHGRHKVFLHEYAIADKLTTNAEYLEFMQDGGYGNFMPWLSEAWEWVKTNNINSPEHWHLVDGQWHQYCLKGGLLPLDLNAPVTHISFYEADAFAKWKGLRLPTEFEWEITAKMYGSLNDNCNFSDNGHYQPRTAVAGNNQFYGDVWEWTSSAYRPYPYYEAPEGAVGEYNGKFMINQMVLRGGSCATPKNHIRVTYRNFFNPHLRWMFSGLRLAKHL